MTDLSPAAQAVLDAAIGVAESPDAEAIACAALRAVADQVVQEPPECGAPLHDYNKGAEDRQKLVRFRLLAIAAELEGSND